MLYNINEEVYMMKIKDSTITFWFQKQPNPKAYVDKFNENLKEHFFDFNIISVPANIDPAIPRLVAVSSSNHSNIEISLINARLRTNFDENYSSDLNLCIKYLKERALKLFEALKVCDIAIVYSAIFINLEKQEDKAVEKIENQFLKTQDIKEIDEIGIRFSKIVDNKFYSNISFNNSKQIKIEKIFENNKPEIIIPLISLNEASKIDNYLNVSLEVNDKYSFNLDTNYSTNRKELEKMFDLITAQLGKEINRFK